MTLLENAKEITYNVKMTASQFEHYKQYCEKEAAKQRWTIADLVLEEDSNCSVYMLLR